jgi:LysR family transcriptional regulator, transcriptional activator of the cysJI operon
MLNLNQLRIFHTAAHSRTLGEAAEKLFLTQPAVSQQIRNLEKHLGTTLFERSRRGVELTPAGRELLAYTEQILRLSAQAEAALTNINNVEEAQAIIGATPNVGSYLLPTWIQAFRAKHPNVTLVIQTATTPQVAAAVSAGQQHLGFVEGEINAVAQVETLELDVMIQRVVVGPDHPWWGRDKVDLYELGGQPMVFRQEKSQSHVWLTAIMQAHGVTPRIIGEFDNPETLKQAVRSSASLTVLPENALQHDIAAGTLWMVAVADVPLERALRLVWPRDVVFSAVVRAMLDHLARTYPAVRALLA